LLRLRDATKAALIVVHHIRKSITREEIGSAFRGYLASLTMSRPLVVGSFFPTCA